MLETILRVIRQFREDSADYFANCDDEIKSSNLSLLRRAVPVSLVLLSVYCLLTIPLFRSPTLTAIYAVSILLDLPLAALVLRVRHGTPAADRTVHAACIAFLLLILGFVLMISVFPFPDRPAIFYPILLLAAAQLFVLPLWESVLVTTLTTAVFLLLSWRYKTPDSFGYDWFGALLAWMIGLLLTYMILELRIREGIARRDLRIASSTDVITGLPNRRSFNLFIEKHFRSCLQKELPLALFMLDVDDFKRYNDTFGHLAGDDCLRRIGGSIQRYASENGLFAARYGGEELVVVLIGEQAACARLYAQDLLDAVHAVNIRRENGAHVTVSLGCASAGPSWAGGHRSLIDRADAALYRAKQEGKDRAVFNEDI